MDTQHYINELTENDILVSESARNVLLGLLKDSDDEYEIIRIYVQGGGCGGMDYSMTFDDQVTDEDSILQCDGFKVAVDPIAIGFLRGCEIDYVEEQMSSSFVFKNAFQSIGGSGMCAGCGGSGH